MDSSLLPSGVVRDPPAGSTLVVALEFGFKLWTRIVLIGILDSHELMVFVNPNKGL